MHFIDDYGKNSLCSQKSKMAIELNGHITLT